MRMRKASLAVAFLVIVSAFCATLVTIPLTVEATTLFVGGGGPGNYTKIQHAITVSGPSDTIFVYSGTYNEDVSINKPLSLIGENKDTTLIRGSGTKDTLLVTSDGVNVIGFSVENGGLSLGWSGIRLFFVQNCYVINNSVYGHERGITFWGAFDNVVENNIVSNNENGIYLWMTVSHSNMIANNEIWNNTAGIYVDESYNNTIIGNIITDNDYGIYLLSSSHNIMHSNLMVGNGVFIYGNSLTYWNTHIISTSNAVNGNPVHYWKNVTGGSIPLGAGQVILANCSNIVINNQDVSNGSVGIAVAFSSHVTITNSTSSSNYAAGISMKNSVSNTISGNVVSWTSGYGLYSDNCSMTTVSQNSFHSNGMPAGPTNQYSALHLGDSDDNMITNNSFFSNFDKAVTLTDSSRNIVSDNAFSNNTLSVILLSSNSNALINNTLRGNIQYFNRLNFGFVLEGSSHNHMIANSVTEHLGGIHFDESHDNTISDNTISTSDARAFFTGIKIIESSSNSFSNNVMDGDGLLIFGDLLDHWNTHIIDTSNTVKGRPIYYWKNVTGGTVPLDASEVILANTTGVVVQNQVLTNGSAGIVLGFSSNNLIADNTLSRTKMGTFLWNSDMNDIIGNAASQDQGGIKVLYSSNNTISGNDYRDNEWGIALRTSNDNTVDANNVWNNHFWGIDVDIVYNFDPGSRNNIITNNSILHNGYSGIIMENEPDGNTVAYNIIVEHGEGIRISGESDNNKVHHNNLINNTLQAYDDKSTNQWDDDYPSGGNYWSDYAGVDVFNGPNQDIPGSDFIGDSPYVIDFDSEDRYPLMSPFQMVPLVPSAPRNLQAVPGDQQVTLTWMAPSFDGGSPVGNYRIYRGTISGGEIFYAQIGNTLTFPDMGLTNGQLYCYRVSAVNGVGEGPLSNEACATPTTTPGAPVILQADLSGNGLENVTVTWDLSSDDGMGQNSVVGYSILRGTIYDVNAVGYQPVANVTKGSILYVDNFTGEGDPNNNFYRICSVDINNLTNCSLNQAGKFTRSLLNGPNLVSIPLTQSVENIETVLQTLKWDKTWTYDSSAQKWKSHMLFKPYKGELEEVNTSRGIWVNVIERSNLTVAGIVPSSTSIYLHAGWNLIAFPSFNLTYLVGDLKAETGATRVEGFDPSAPPYFLRALADGDILRTGFGYWVSVVNETTWTIDNS